MYNVREDDIANKGTHKIAYVFQVPCRLRIVDVKYSNRMAGVFPITYHLSLCL